MKTKPFHELQAAVREATAREVGLYPVRFIKWKSDRERGRVVPNNRELKKGEKRD